MKRLIIAAAALSISATAISAEIGAPFEQNELDRALPTLPDTVAAFERVQLAQVGGGSYKSDEGTGMGSPWANDHNFISPAQ